MAKDEPIALEELARGHCLAVRNAYRLIEDGEVLLSSNRHLSAINLFRLAAEELAKAHLITQAAIYDESNKEGWEWFWRSFGDHREKLRILEYEFHWKGYQDKDEFNRTIVLLRQQREDALYVGLDPNSKKFLPAGSMLKSEKDSSELEHKYILRVMEFFMPVGLPTPEVMVETYKHMREERGTIK